MKRTPKAEMQIEALYQDHATLFPKARLEIRDDHATARPEY